MGQARFGGDAAVARLEAHVMVQPHSEAFWELIQADVDGEVEHMLDAAELRIYREHVADCPQCQQIQVSLRGLHRGLEAASPRSELREGFEDHLRARLAHAEASVPSKPRPYARFGRLLHGLTGFALGAAAMALVVAVLPKSEHVPSQLMAAQLSAHLAGRPLDVVASQPAVAAQWLARRLPFKVPAVNLESTGFRLSGARLEAINHKPVAILVYSPASGAGGEISIAIWAEPEARDSAPQVLRREQDHFVYWRQGQLEFWVSSRLPTATLTAFAKAWKAAAV